MTKSEIKKYLAEIGRKGGKATGQAKVRGSSDYYRKLRMTGRKGTKSKT